MVDHLRKLEQYFPIISVTGPRQAGKTTLLKHLYPNYQYLSLEDPDLRQRAQEDPRGFLNQYNQTELPHQQHIPTIIQNLIILKTNSCFPQIDTCVG